MGPSARPRSKLRLLVWFAGSLLFTVMLFEAALRTLAYTDLEWGKNLRHARLYADRWNDPLYWQLTQRWTNSPGKLPEHAADSRLGWVDHEEQRTGQIEPREQALAGRRPILLFGDSFIRCMTNEANCFEGWLERSARGETHAIVNYGVRAYGIDQICLMAERVLERWRGRNAVAVIGIYVEDDLDRAYLDHRGWPKPRFTLDEQGTLVEPAPVPTPEQYDRDHPVWKRSLAWGWLLHGSGWLPRGVQRSLSHAARLEEEKKRLSSAILERLENFLQANEIEHFYALFPSARECATLEPHDWQENFLIDWLDARRLPYVNIKREIYRAALEQSRHPLEFYGIEGVLDGHLTPEGNHIALRGLLRGVDGDFDRTNGRRLRHISEFRDLDNTKGDRVREESGWSERFPDAEDGERIMLFPKPEQPARVGCDPWPSRRFVATAKYRPPVGSTASGPLRLQIKVDQLLVKEVVLDTSTPSADLEVDVLNRSYIEIIATQVESKEPPTALVVLSNPRFV